jgi:hypothetical protein
MSVTNGIPLGCSPLLPVDTVNSVRALKGAIIEAWSQYKAADVVKLGYRGVEADGSKFYLNHLHPTSYQWSDIGANISPGAEMELMLGGEICMWTLEYREGACDPTDTHGCGIPQFAPSADKLFSQSFGSIVWPRAAVGAGSFWNYNPQWARCSLSVLDRKLPSRMILGFTILCDAIRAVTEFMVRVLHSRMALGFTMLLGLKPGHEGDPNSISLIGAHFLTGGTINSVTKLKDFATDLEERHAHFALVLTQRGVVSCPANCTCDYGYACGRPYA